ncbi:hypothetical protein PM082_012815 [Marasmius tenuissimus]|nr:hypothetical protein PM082_012815 [Marasmius tenuissimus]
MERNAVIQNQHIGSGVQNNNNGGGTQNVNFVNSFKTTVRRPHKTLWDAVSGIGASHTAEQQYERGECLEGTREEVIRIIREWLLAKKHLPICWLTGAAGVGKSAIAMTLAKSCEEDGCLVSSFFFFRSDPKRDNPSALALTVAHGLVSTRPFMRSVVEQRISKDPRILEAKLEDQFCELILKTVMKRNWQRRLLSAFVKVPDIVIIDGLDECGDENTQSRILSTIVSAFQQAPHFPLRFLICSRPESWIREAFNASLLQQLSEVIVLDELFMPDRDILRYYRHHFQEISRDPKYSQVPFPDLWPSEEQLEALVARTCGQFVFAVTVIKFLKLAFNHPIIQLRVILENTPPPQSGTPPYRQLDELYDFILQTNPNHEEVLHILAAVLVLPTHLDLEPSPAHIELLLGLSLGQLTLTLRAMHSVLEIRGPRDSIRLFHTSFREYLLDHDRSRHFHIDMPARRDIIVRQWLQNLATNKVRTYSFNQLNDKETKSFFTKWIKFCTLILKPTLDVLRDLQNVDLASIFIHDQAGRIVVQKWDRVFQNLVPWVEKYHGERNQVEANDDEQEAANLMEALIHRLQNRPESFHLEWSPGVSPLDDTIHWVIQRATGCRWSPKLTRSPPTSLPLRLTDCDCDGSRLDNLGHLEYQQACVQLVRASTSLFGELAWLSDEKDEEIIYGVAFALPDFFRTGGGLFDIAD